MKQNYFKAIVIGLIFFSFTAQANSLDELNKFIKALGKKKDTETKINYINAQKTQLGKFITTKGITTWLKTNEKSLTTAFESIKSEEKLKKTLSDIFTETVLPSKKLKYLEFFKNFFSPAIGENETNQIILDVAKANKKIFDLKQKNIKFSVQLIKAAFKQKLDEFTKQLYNLMTTDQKKINKNNKDILPPAIQAKLKKAQNKAYTLEEIAELHKEIKLDKEKSLKAVQNFGSALSQIG